MRDGHAQNTSGKDGAQEAPRAPYISPNAVPGDEVEDPCAWFYDRWREAARRRMWAPRKLYLTGADARDPIRIKAKLEAEAIELAEELHRGRQEPLAIRWCGPPAGGLDVPAGVLDRAEDGPKVSPGVRGHNCNPDTGTGVHWTALEVVPLAERLQRGLAGLVPGGRLSAVDEFKPGDGFLGGVQALTKTHRTGLAVRHALAVAVDELAAAEEMANPSGEVVSRTRRVKGKPCKVDVPILEALKASAKWHGQRSHGQRARFETVRHCGEGGIEIRCAACQGYTRGISLGCQVGRLCVPCRERASGPIRQEFARARVSVLAEGRRRSWNRVGRRGGVYTEKFLTLTVPHRGAPGCGVENCVCAVCLDAVERRITVLFGAWRRFSMKWKLWLRRRYKCATCGAAEGLTCRDVGGKACKSHKGREEHVEWMRAFEWTGGKSDSLGHPHFHLWAYCPYLPDGLARSWWALALEQEGVKLWSDEERAEVFDRTDRRFLRGRSIVAFGRVVLDVRQVRVEPEKFSAELLKGGKAIKHERTRLRIRDVGARRARGGEDVAEYMLGWSLSERDSNGRFIDRAVSARVYEALEHRRLNQAARGFMARGRRRCACPECGSAFHFRAQVVKWSHPEIAALRESFGLVARPVRAGPGLRKADARDVAGQLGLRLVV